MADRFSKSYAPNFVTETSGGDQTKTVFQKHINELTAIYAILSRIEKFDAGTSAPADKGTYSIWLDTSTTPATLKYWSGSAWVNVFPDDWAGDQDVNGHKIISSSDGDIELEPNGTGTIILDGPVDVAGAMDIEGAVDIADAFSLSGDGKGADFNANTAYFTAQVVSASAINWTKGNIAKKTLSGNITVTMTAPPGPAWLTFVVTQAASPATITWPSGIKWRGSYNDYKTTNDAPDLSTASAVYIISFYYDGTSYHGAY